MPQDPEIMLRLAFAFERAVAAFERLVETSARRLAFEEKREIRMAAKQGWVEEPPKPDKPKNTEKSIETGMTHPLETPGFPEKIDH